MAQYNHVTGDIDQLYGANGYSIDAVTGKISFDKSQGAVLGYARTFTEKLRGTVAMGFNRGDTIQAVDNRTLRQLFVNLIYSPITDVELGGELIHGTRKTFVGDTGTMSRFDFMGRYTF